MKYVSNKDRILSSLRRYKRPVSAHQLAARLDLTGGTNAVYTCISQLRKDGYSIDKMKDREGFTRYSLS